MGCVAAAGASLTYRSAFPAASDLAGIYEDVGTRLDGNIERPLVSILNLCIRRAGDTRYPDIPRRFSVRTEDLSAGLLRVGDDRWALDELTESQHHLIGNVSWPG